MSYHTYDLSSDDLSLDLTFYFVIFGGTSGFGNVIFLLTQCLYKYLCFSLDSVRVGTFVMSACGFRVMTH